MYYLLMILCMLFYDETPIKIILQTCNIVQFQVDVHSALKLVINCIVCF